MKRTYSLDAPDQQRLKIARAKIEGILKEHDLAGVVTLHTPGMTEFFYDITPSYSRVWIDEKAQQLRVRSKLEEYGGDQAAQLQDQAATANMIHGLATDLASAAGMFGSIAPFVDRALRAEHTDQGYRPDPSAARPAMSSIRTHGVINDDGDLLIGQRGDGSPVWNDPEDALPLRRVMHFTEAEARCKAWELAGAGYGPTGISELHFSATSDQPKEP